VKKHPGKRYIQGEDTSRAKIYPEQSLPRKGYIPNIDASRVGILPGRPRTRIHPGKGYIQGTDTSRERIHAGKIGSKNAFRA